MLLPRSPILFISHTTYFSDTLKPTREMYCFTPLPHLSGVMVLVQQSVQQFSHVAMLLWFFINQRQVFSSQLVNSRWCERLSSFIVCHWLLQPVVRILATSHTVQVPQTQTGRLGACAVQRPRHQFLFTYYLLVLPLCYYFTACWADMEESSTLVWQNRVKLIRG